MFILALYILSTCIYIGNCVRNIENSLEKQLENKLFYDETVIEDVIEKFNEVISVVNEFDSIFTIDIAWLIIMCFIYHFYLIILYSGCDAYDPTTYRYLIALDLYSFFTLLYHLHFSIRR